MYNNKNKNKKRWCDSVARCGCNGSRQRRRPAKPRADAAELAAAFARFDANDDMVLQPEELEALGRSEGFDLTPAEVSEAARLLDRNGDGLVSFPEFADWYVNKVKPPPPAAAS